MKRRTLLLGTPAIVTGLAGCSALSSPSSMLTVTVVSHAENPYTVELTLFRRSADISRSEARVYDASIDVEPQGQAQRTGVAEARPYLVRYSVYENNRKLTDEDHIHYYPPDNGGDDSLTFDIDSIGVLTRR